jgi:hypothetical protein
MPMNELIIDMPGNAVINGISFASFFADYPFFHFGRLDFGMVA